MLHSISGRRRGVRAVLTAAAALALTAAGCGGDDEAETAVDAPEATQTEQTQATDAATEGQTATQPAEGEVLQAFTVTETSFELNSPEIEKQGQALDITVDRPGTYTFRAVNEADIPHALLVEGHGIEQETETLQPGQAAELTVTLSEPGEYDLYCPIANHKQLGMDGSVQVAG